MAEFVLDKVVHPLFGEADSVNTGEQGRDLRSHRDLLGQVVSNVSFFFSLQHKALFFRNKFTSLNVLVALAWTCFSTFHFLCSVLERCDRGQRGLWRRDREEGAGSNVHVSLAFKTVTLSFQIRNAEVSHGQKHGQETPEVLRKSERLPVQFAVGGVNRLESS